MRVSGNLSYSNSKVCDDRFHTFTCGKCKLQVSRLWSVVALLEMLGTTLFRSQHPPGGALIYIYIYMARFRALMTRYVRRPLLQQ